MQAVHEVNGPRFAHAILTTEELLALVPANINLPASIVMSPEAMVDATLVGLGQGELVTISGLQDEDEWTRFEAACRAVANQFGNAVPAPRYRIGVPAPA